MSICSPSRSRTSAAPWISSCMWWIRKTAGAPGRLGSKGPHPPLRNLRGDLLPVYFRFARLKGDPERGDQIVFAYRWHGFVAFLSLLLTSDKVTPCLSLNISTLLGAVMFHVNLTASIPPVGYHAIADRIMITSFSCSFFRWGGYPPLGPKKGEKGLGPAGLPPGPRFHSPLAPILYLAVFLLPDRRARR